MESSCLTLMGETGDGASVDVVTGAVGVMNFGKDVAKASPRWQAGPDPVPFLQFPSSLHRCRES